MTAECFLGLGMAVTHPRPDLWGHTAQGSTRGEGVTSLLHIPGHSTPVVGDLLGQAILQAATASPPTSLQVQITATQWPPQRATPRPPPPTSQSAPWLTAVCGAGGRKTEMPPLPATGLRLSQKLSLCQTWHPAMHLLFLRRDLTCLPSTPRGLHPILTCRE